MIRATFALALTTVVTLGAHAAPAARAVDYGKSRITVITRQLNVPLEGEFRRFNAQVLWDASAPQTSQAQLDIDVSSLDFGEKTMNDEATAKSFFDARTHPNARFVSKQVKAAGAGRYDVAGTLTIKGVSKDITVPMALKQEGGSELLEGATTIRRLDYRIGEGEWADTATLADAVGIKFRLVLGAAR